MNRLLTPKSYPLIDAELDRFDVFAKPFTQYVGDKLRTVGMRIGVRPNHAVAFFGDRILIRPNGTYVVRPADVMSAARFNYLHKVGTPVIAYPGVRPEHGANCTRLETRTRSEARMFGDEPVVWVEGHSACIALSHVDVVGGAL